MAGVQGSQAGGSYQAVVRIDTAAVEAVCGSDVRAGLIRAGNRTKGRVKANISSAGRIDTGAMKDTVRVDEPTGSLVRGTLQLEVVAPQPYTMFQEAGTRAHGPRTAPFLVFTPKGSNRAVFARRVKGVRAARFMIHAAQALTAADFA